MPPEADRRAVQQLLAGLTNAEVRAIGIEALRGWRSKHPHEPTFSMHGSLGLEIAPLLAERQGIGEIDAARLKEPFRYCLGETWMQPVVELVWWMIRAGLAIPLLNSSDGYPGSLRLTSAGERLLADRRDHPLLPGFLARAANRSVGLPDAVLAHLSDAQDCLDHALLRPGVVLAGLAYESALEAIAERLVTRGRLPENVNGMKAGKRLAAVKSSIEAVLQEREARFAAHAACDFADALRRRRNDAAHTTPVFAFDDPAEVEELLISAARHLPALWSLAA